ncbi:MAG: CHAT domain-containing protein, partial [Bacteroidota bacterium]
CLSAGLLLGRLEQAITEATTIADQFGPDQATVWTNAQATEDQLTSAKPHLYRYLHFATHGLVNTTQADYSRILLWPTTESDGCLNLYELFNQKWNADLVSLSACETGLGQLVKGEGMIGFTRALLYAGTRSVVLSLWEVADESTRELFVRYYDSLSGDGRDKYGALREVQLSMIEGGGAWSNPYYWAPFVFIGERYGSK